jgi:hypothetical protein
MSKNNPPIFPTPDELFRQEQSAVCQNITPKINFGSRGKKSKGKRDQAVTT